MKLLIPMCGEASQHYTSLNGKCGSGFAKLTWTELKNVMPLAYQSADLSHVNNRTQINQFIGRHGISRFDEQTPESLTAFYGGILPPLRDVSDETVVRAPGTHKEFEAARKAGIIVLKPLTKYKFHVSDRYVPIIGPDSVRGGQFYRTNFGLLKPIDLEPKYDEVCDWSAPVIWVNMEYVGDMTLLASTNLDKVHKLPVGNSYYYLFDNASVESFFTKHGAPSMQDLLTAFSHEVPPGLINPALDEIYSGAYDILTEIGEAQETVSYLFGILRDMVKLAISARSKEAAARRVLRGKDLVDEVLSIWMQFRYAISPLAYSFNDVAEYLSAKTLNEYVTARKRRDIQVEREVNGWTYRFTVEHRVFAKGRIDLKATTAQLGVNPLKTLWELTPLAFVVNWVIPVGAMLGALVPPQSLLQIATSHSMRIRGAEAERDGVVFPIDLDYYKNEIIPAKAEFWLMPELYLNWKRGIDALALSWSMFLKRLWK